MHTEHLASSHSFMSSTLSNGFLDDERLALLELQGKGDALDLSNDKPRLLLSFGIIAPKENTLVA